MPASTSIFIISKMIIIEYNLVDFIIITSRLLALVVRV